MDNTRNIVLLGASYAGMNSAHYLLKHIIPQLSSDSGVQYKLIGINPSTKFFMRHGSPRAAGVPGLIPDEKLFIDIQKALAQYGDAVTFIQGKATSWDVANRRIEVHTVDGGEELIAYHALIVATGSKTQSPIFSDHGMPHTETQAVLRSLHAKLETAKSIVVAGGGPAGVEVAAEISEHLNGAAGWFSSRPAHPKAKVTIVTNGRKLLPALRESIAKQAEIYLSRVGVDVRYETKVMSAEEQADGTTKVLLHDGEELRADIYISAMGALPTTEWVPEHLLNSKGFLEQNAQTLRVDAAGSGVYAIGDVGSASNCSITIISAQVPVVMTNLKRDLLASHSGLEAKPEGEDRLFVADKREMQLVPIGRSKAVGAVFGWWLPSWAGWLIKGRTYMLDSLPDMFYTGSQWAKAQ